MLYWIIKNSIFTLALTQWKFYITHTHTHTLASWIYLTLVLELNFSPAIAIITFWKFTHDISSFYLIFNINDFFFGSFCLFQFRVIQYYFFAAAVLLLLAFWIWMYLRIQWLDPKIPFHHHAGYWIIFHLIMPRVSKYRQFRHISTILLFHTPH